MPANNPYSELIAQAAKAAAAIKGLSAVADAGRSVFVNLKNFMDYGLIGALTNFAANLAKATAGLAAMGAAALPGGFRVLGEVVSYLATVIGSVATPVFVVVTAAAVALADMFSGQLLTATKAVAEWLGNYLVPIIGKVVLAIDIFVNALTIAADETVSWAADKLRKIGAWLADVKIDEPRPNLDAAKNRADLLAKVNELIKPIEPGGPGGGLGEKFGKAFGDIVKALQLEMGKQGQVGFSSLTDVWKQLQMQSFVSPLEQRKLDMWAKLMVLLEKMAVDLRKPQPAAVVE